MQGMRRIALVVGLFVALAPAVPAAAGPQALRVTVAKTENGPFVTGSPEVQVHNKAKDFFIRVRNRTTEIQDLELLDISDDPGNDFRIKWFRGGQDVTDDAQGTGYTFMFDANERRTFRALVKPRVSDPGPLCLTARFNVANNPYYFLGFFYVNNNTICG